MIKLDPEYYFDSYFRPFVIGFMITAYSLWVLGYMTFRDALPLFGGIFVLMTMSGFAVTGSKTTNYFFFPTVVLFAIFSIQEAAYDAFAFYIFGIIATLIMTLLTVKDWDTEFLKRLSFELKHVLAVIVLTVVPHMFSIFI